MSDLIKSERTRLDMTQQDLADRLGLKKSAIAKYENGRVENLKRSTIEKMAKIFNCSPAYLMGWTDNVKPMKTLSQESFISIDILGSVPAGTPIEAIEDIVGQVRIPENWTDDGSEYRALRVRGDSMYPMYIEGDTVIIRIQPDCNNRQDAVVFVNGYDATLKKVIKNHDGTITLQAINPEWQSKTYGPDDDEIRIWGVVVKLERDF
ncbi:LexA family protein [Eubacterium barkeri]|nr:S24 family peptidase [Eubacterium barkeri]